MTQIPSQSQLQAELMPLQNAKRIAQGQVEYMFIQGKINEMQKMINNTNDQTVELRKENKGFKQRLDKTLSIRYSTIYR